MRKSKSYLDIYSSFKLFALVVLATYHQANANGLNYLQYYNYLTAGQGITNGWGVSLAGGADIMIFGPRLSPAQQLTVIFQLFQPSSGTFAGPAPSQNNAYKSDVLNGKLQYTIPNIAWLLGSVMEELIDIDNVAFTLGLVDPAVQDEAHGSPIINGPFSATTLVCSRYWTPILYYLNPRVLYLGEEVDVYVDPKSTTQLQATGEWPFTSVSINSQIIDFNDFVDETTTLNGYSVNQIRGYLNSANYNVSSSAQVQFLNRAGYAINDPQSSVCSIDNLTCYDAKTVPTITSISSQSGYASGNDYIVINGAGFNANTTVTIDQASATVNYYANTWLIISTGANLNPTSNSYYIGSPGIKRSFFNGTQKLTGTPSWVVLATSFENPQNVLASPSGNLYQGLFKAPVTCNYRFYMSCDDSCSLWMNTAGQDPTQKQQILSVGSGTSYRGYWQYLDGSKVTAWISLTAGQYYYIEGRHVQGWGGDHFTVSVEMDANKMVGHHQAMKEIQRLQISATNTKEQWKIVVTNPDGKSLTISITKPTDSTQQWTSSSFANNDSPSNVKNAISSFWSTYFGSSITVTQTMTDSTGATTTTTASAAQIVYLVTVNRQVSKATFTTAQISKQSGTTASIQVTAPASVQLSSAPLSGSFTITCTNANGVQLTTSDIPYNQNTWTILNTIQNTCTQYKDKLTLWDGPNNDGYYEDGRDIIIRFGSYNADPPQMVINSAADKPLSGSSLHLTSTTQTPYGTNLVYEPIPYEWLFTNEVLPQVVVSTNGQQAVCASLNCGYTYIQTYGTVDSFSLSGLTLTLTGTNMTTQGISVTYANQNCTITSKSATSIVCTLPSTTAGSNWTPQLVDAFGLLPLGGAANAVPILVTVSSVSPSTSLNNQGGNTLTITGTNFPASISEPSTVLITLPDGSKCTPLTISPTQITCFTSVYTGSSTSGVAITVSVNGQQDSSQTVSFQTSPFKVASLSPIQLSPVLASTITLTLNSYSGTLDPTQLTAKLISTTNSSLIIPLNVVSLSNSAFTVTVKYNGAPAGTYNVKVLSSAIGYFDTTAVSITTVGTITSFSPSSGSIYGGTLLTINGYVFSNTATDNAVQVGYTPCDVVTTTPTSITCRLEPKLASDPTTNDVIVFLRTFEEATCLAGAGKCQFTWVDNTTNGFPVLTSYSTAFSGSLNQWVLTLTGTFGSITTSSVTFYIDGTQQTVTAASSTSISITISGMNDASSTNVGFYLPIGTPYIASPIAIQLTPTLVSISPSTGSPAGSVITASVPGVGPYTQGVQLLYGSTPLCTSVVIQSYGVVQCTTVAATIASSTISLSYAGSTTKCSTCIYSTSSSYPAVTSQSISGNTVVFVGTNFFTSGYTASVTFGGVPADSVSIDSAIQVTATWKNGVPLVAAAQIPTLSFVGTVQSSGTHVATNTATLANPPPTSKAIDQAVTCSFAGGCTLSITQAGLTATLANTNNQVTVCGVPAILSSSSSSTQAIFSLPPLQTVYSMDNYNISQPISISGSYFDDQNNFTLGGQAFDGNTQVGYTSSSAGCFFGTSFNTNYVGDISQVKFWMNPFILSKLANNLLFQGSNNNIAWTTLVTVGQEIHEGWNYYPFTTNQKYRYYRFSSASTTVTGVCNIGEVVLTGAVVIDSNSPTYPCSASLVLGSTTTPLTGTITYQATSTAFLTSISPRYGKVQGGDSVTFTGTGFVSDISKYIITLDGINCIATAATTTSVTCTTGSRPGIIPTSTVLFITGQGNVATNGLVFRYVNLWSSPATWGGNFAPMAGSTVDIPVGLNLLVDISPPVLNAVIVEGSLIFPPQANSQTVMTFDASYIMLKGGYMEVGTEQFPYTSKLIITMHGTRTDPKLPDYGNKVIACYQCTLDLHGVPRNPTWTELLTTAQAGATTITLNTAVDWIAGEVIVVAPTAYDPLETEQFTIVSVNNANVNNPVITLDSPLNFTHFAGIQNFNGTDFIEMRAEVALITRNIVYQGDPSTSINDQFGAHIMLSSAGDESLTGRIAYIECRYVGQAFLLGRYPIHFHMIGTVSNSYVIGNSIHDTYNRAVTAHHVFYLRVMNNVAYNTQGHTFFVEDAIETGNYYYHNLAVKVRASWSLLNTDTTPACFWITNQNNIFIGNHAVGSERYGFWFDSKPNPTGPSFTPSICPDHGQLGEFVNNTAHTNNKYGLRVFHKMIPLTYPCLGIIYDPTNTNDPYWQNPLITANFINYTGWMNEEDNAIFEEMGDVRFINFKVADALIGNLEVSLAGDLLQDGHVQIINALVIGASANANSLTLSEPVRGIITARTENLQINGAAFYNFPQTSSAAIGTCSHCFHAAATDSGARTITVSGLRFDYGSVPTKIIYQIPYRDIFYDLDGSLTGLGPKTWATAYFRHNYQPECQYLDTEYNGLICDSTVQVRRIAFWNLNPQIIFDDMELHILQYDATNTSALNSTQLSSYIGNNTNYGVVPFKLKQSPMHGWAVPFVTGHKYRASWGFAPMDWMDLTATQSSRWTSNDLGVYLIMNFTDVRQQINVTTVQPVYSDTSNNGVTTTTQTFLSTLIANATLDQTDTKWASNTNYVTGNNIILNDTATRETHVIFNGKNGPNIEVDFAGARCVGFCGTQTQTVAISNTTILWSDPKSWASANATMPIANDNVTIIPGWNMIYDIASSPILNYLEINGRLTFLNNGTDQTLSSKDIFVREGQLLIGNSTVPYIATAKIILYGDPSDEQIVFENSIEAGNKILTNTNLMAFYGKQRQQYTRLQQEVYPNTNTIYVETGLDWKAGDRIALAPTSMNYLDSDYAIVKTYVNTTGQVTLDRQLSAYHYGDSASTVPTYGFDIRGEVVLLSRNIQILGDTSTNAWGCTILTSDYNDFGVLRNGTTIFDSVEIYNCSQFDTMKSALRFESANLGYSSITNSSVYLGWGIGINILESSNIKIQNTNIFSFIRFGIFIETSLNITLDGNTLIGVFTRGLKAMDEFVDISGGIIACGKDPNDQCSYSITNNIVSGTYFSGYVVHGHDCGKSSTQTVFRNNIAHSSQGTGAVIFPNVLSPTQANCMEGSYFYAYKTQLAGAVSAFGSTNQTYSNMVFLDNAVGPVLNGNYEADNLWSQMNNVTIWGESPAKDCLTAGACTNAATGSGCIDRQAFWMPYWSRSGKVPMPTMASELPLQVADAMGVWGGNSLMTGLMFRNFTNLNTYCGNQQTIFNLNGKAPDYQPRAKFSNTTFDNVVQDSIAFLYSPQWSWANPDDCGNWPCSGPNNTYLQFNGVTVTGSITPGYVQNGKDFQILPKNSQAVASYSNCNSVLAWNAYYCTDAYVGILLFESLDSDNTMRTITPISISTTMNSSVKSTSTVNTFMDHVWDGFYTGQIRLSRWPSIVEVGYNTSYTITYTGTPPKVQRFKLITDSPYGIKVTIQYSTADLYQVVNFDSQVIQQQNTWNNTLKAPQPIGISRCGENTYNGVIDTLQFYINSSCTLEIQNVDSIQSSVRLQWTVAQFYADGGSTTFADRVSASLGIQPQDINVVAVYQGSVFVTYHIVRKSQDALNTYASLDTLNSVLQQQLSTGQINMGAPIISVSVGTIPLTLQPTGYNIKVNGTTPNNTTPGLPTNPPIVTPTKNNGTSGGNGTTTQKVIIINNNGTQTVVQTQSTTQSSNLTIIIILAAIAGIIVLGGILGFVIYRKCGKANKGGAIIPGEFTTQIGAHGQIGNSPEMATEIQYHPKAEIGTIFGSPDEQYKTNNADVIDQNEISHMSNNKMFTPERDSNMVHTNQHNFAEGDQLNQLENLSSNRAVQVKSGKRDQYSQ